MKRLAVALAIGALSWPWPGRAQQRHQLTFEAWPYRGAVGYAQAVAPRLHVGGVLGMGVGQDARVLIPRERSAGEIVYLAAFLRLSRPFVTRWGSDWWLVTDAGVRVAPLVDHASCGDIGCAASFLGAYVQPMVGGRHLSVGPRLLAGWAAAHLPGCFALAVVPVTLRLTLGW